MKQRQKVELMRSLVKSYLTSSAGCFGKPFGTQPYKRFAELRRANIIPNATMIRWNCLQWFLLSITDSSKTSCNTLWRAQSSPPTKKLATRPVSARFQLCNTSRKAGLLTIAGYGRSLMPNLPPKKQLFRLMRKECTHPKKLSCEVQDITIIIIIHNSTQYNQIIIYFLNTYTYDYSRINSLANSPFKAYSQRIRGQGSRSTSGNSPEGIGFAYQSSKFQVSFSSQELITSFFRSSSSFSIRCSFNYSRRLSLQRRIRFQAEMSASLPQVSRFVLISACSWIWLRRRCSFLSMSSITVCMLSQLQHPAKQFFFCSESRTLSDSNLILYSILICFQRSARINPSLSFRRVYAFCSPPFRFYSHFLHSRISLSTLSSNSSCSTGCNPDSYISQSISVSERLCSQSSLLLCYLSCICCCIALSLSFLRSSNLQFLSQMISLSISTFQPTQANVDSYCSMVYADFYYAWIRSVKLDISVCCTCNEYSNYDIIFVRYLLSDQISVLVFRRERISSSSDLIFATRRNISSCSLPRRFSFAGQLLNIFWREEQRIGIDGTLGFDWFILQQRLQNINLILNYHQSKRQIIYEINR